MTPEQDPWFLDHPGERSVPTETGLRPSSGTSQAKDRLIALIGRLRELCDEYGGWVYESDEECAQAVLEALRLEQIGWMDFGRSHPWHPAGCICTLKYKHSDFTPVYSLASDEGDAP